MLYFVVLDGLHGVVYIVVFIYKITAIEVCDSAYCLLLSVNGIFLY